ncbi:hypothetical protein A3A63_02565 [Candidatus Gottesmanbacteria bacterium RIFCSPLOWO2_01_FULL_46_9]|uniref:DUF1648 domain-containing protein n=1 Tax=Candidatus Gottesmanbacteria bacterium RIFCSPLOWO2_01_FULL_46_9 TaxID=1798394 RepID=A0A1F6B388_9BACT|nr:MAG: hypothetical protein A3A63_02565 [Candidatus Gottesmanbacteria bacterium RIFCSPLOWO2_01_FULL_46_9]
MNSKPHSQQINTAWAAIKTNWLIQLVNKIVIVVTICSIAAIILRWNKLPPLVPLWYSRPWGADQLAPPVWLFILPVGSILLYGINITISIYLTAEYLIFTQVLFLTSLLVSLLSCITLIKILFLVT